MLKFILPSTTAGEKQHFQVSGPENSIISLWWENHEAMASISTIPAVPFLWYVDKGYLSLVHKHATCIRLEANIPYCYLTEFKP